MRTILKFIFLFLLFSVLSVSVRSQDFYFSQFYNTPTYYNPAYAGFDNGLKARVHFRDHWPIYDKDLKIYNLELDCAEREVPGFGGWGLIVNTSPEGDGVVSKTSIGGMLSSRIRINRYVVTQVGFSGVYVQKSTNFDNNYIFSGQLDNKHGFIYPNLNIPGASGIQDIAYPDFNLGALIAYERKNILARAGVAVHHLLKPNEAFFTTEQTLPRRYVAHGDLVITPFRNPRGGWTFNPGALYEFHSYIHTIQVGLNVKRSVLYAGAWYRNRQSFDETFPFKIQSIIGLVGIEIPLEDMYSRVKLHYSYDVGLGYMQGTGGSHEISLRFEFDRVRLIKRWSNYSHEVPLIHRPIRF